MGYAGFWKRFVAMLIDGIILSLIGGLVNLLLADWLAGLISVFLGWAYFSYMESSVSQATFGKQAMGIYVTDINGQRISFLRATGRYLGKYLSAFILLIGYIMAAFTARKQALHDILAGTLVLSR